MSKIKSRSSLARLVNLILVQKKSLLFAFVGTIVQVILTVYIPILIGQTVNQVIGVNQVHFDLLIPILIKMAVVIILNAIVQWINPLLYNRITYFTIEKLRQRALNQLHRLPLSFIDRHSTGDLVSRIITDTEQLSDGLIMVFNQFFIGILTIFVTILTMLRLDVLMTLIVVLLTPISLFVARFIAKKSYTLFQKQTETRGKHAEFVEESIQQGELVRLFNIQEASVTHFRELNDEYMSYSRQAIFYSSTINPVTRAINALIYGVLTFTGVFRIINGGFSVGELVTFLNYANQYTKPFNDISGVLAELQSALACAERLFSLIDQEAEEETGYKLIDSSHLKGKIGFNQVSFSYNKIEPLIKDLTLSVQPGMRVAIVGPTGAGKSTLINLLMRFYDLDQGQILIDNQPMEDYTRETIRQQFGMVLQETWLKSGTIHENIAYGEPTASREQVINAAKQAHIHHFIKTLPYGYDTYLSDSGESLSVGQRQLLSIARLFVKVPPMLILDEATSSIDTRTELLIQEAFAKLMKGKTSFIIAHRLSTIQNSDVILVMDQGKIIEQGSHEMLMKARGFYYLMQTAQSK